MQGYIWAKTAAGALLVVLVTDQGGFVPGKEDAIDMSEITLVEPVTWPKLSTAPNLNLVPQSFGVPAAAAERECVILPFAANG